MHRPQPTRPIIAVLATALLAAAVPARGETPSAAAGPDPEAGSWNLSLGFSYVATGGNTSTTSAGVDAAFSRQWTTWSLDASGKAISASEDGVTTADRSTLGVQVARDLARGLGFTAGWRGERDRFAGLDLRSVLNAGVEWRALRDGPWTLLATSALTWTRVEARGPTPAEDYLGGLVAARSRVRLSATASTTQEVSYYSKVDDASGWRVEAAAGLEAAVSSHLAVKLGWEYRYDNDPVPGFGKTDTATRASLVVQLGDGEAKSR